MNQSLLLRRLIAGLMIFLPLRAESLVTNRRSVAWTLGQRITFGAREVKIERLMGGEAPPVLVSLPIGTLWASWRPEGLYALVEVPASESTREHLEVRLRATGASDWMCYAVLPEGLGAVRAAVPTADGRLFLVPSGPGFPIPEGQGQAPSTAWAAFLLMGKNPKGQWTKFEPVDLDWGPPFQTHMGKGGKSFWAKPTHRYDFLDSARIETPDLADRLFELEEGWALVDRHHGMIWVFDAKGTVKRHISLYEDFKDEDLDRPLMAFPTSVLACESAPDGKLIVAIRNDIAFFFSRKVWPVSGDPKNPTPADSYLLQQAQAAKDFPDITWKTVDTATGEVRSIPAPKGQPSKYVFRPEDPNWHFHFKVGADGQVEPPAPPPTPVEGAKKH